MAQAIHGLEVSKVDEKNRMEKRCLRVLCDVKSDRKSGRKADLQLQWSKAPYKDWRPRSSCDLAQVPPDLFLGLHGVLERKSSFF